ncbi:hypothetical protein HPY42_06145 [Coprothermobacteraceae bacterium]|nr:hypothetical protein [Coprothermobacteraceae bacterium]
MPKAIKVGVACTLLMLLLTQGVAAYTVGIPTQALDGLTSPELVQFEETVLTLFEGYSGLSINVVKDSPENLWNMLRDGSLDAIIARPDSSFIAVTSKRGKPLAWATLSVPIKGSSACLRETEENKRLLQPLGLQPSQSETCLGRTDIRVRLVPAYPLSQSNEAIADAFEAFSSLHPDAIALAAKSVGFEPVQRSLLEKAVANPYRALAPLLLVAIVLYALYVAYRARKSLTNYLRTMHLQQQEVDHLIDQLMQMREQLDAITEEHEALQEEKRTWERTQKITESYVNGFIEMLKVIELFGRSSPEAAIVDSVSRRAKLMLAAEELAIYRYDNRSRKLYLQAGDDTTLPRELNAGDPLVHSTVYLKGFDQKTVEGRNIFLCSVGPVGKTHGLMAVVEPKVLNARQLVQSLANLLYFMVSYQETSLKTFAYKKYTNLLLMILDAASFTEIKQILETAGFEFLSSESPAEVVAGSAHQIELPGTNLVLTVPEDWPWEFDNILTKLLEARLDS